MIIGAKVDGVWEYGTVYTWNGHELQSSKEFQNFGYTTDPTSWTYFNEITYTYNADGIRTSKTADGITREYILSGSQIMGERWTQSSMEYLL